MKHISAQRKIKRLQNRAPELFALPLLCCVLLILCRSTLGQESSTSNGSRTASRDSVAMTVDERQISVSELCAAIRTLPPPQAQGFPLHPPLAAQWYGPLVALAEEAKREHLGQQFLNDEISPVDQANALSAELIRKIARQSEPTEAEIQQYYAAHPHEFERTEARRIVISHATALASRSTRSVSEAQAKANAIDVELKQGADFGSLAAKESDDPYTKSKGGDLGDVSHNQMEPEVDHVIWSLAPGATSAPFAGRFGYEIVKVESRRILPLNEARETIIGNVKFLKTARLRQAIIAAARISLKKTYMDSPLPCEVNTATITK
jgi:hypothetical protein